MSGPIEVVIANQCEHGLAMTWFLTVSNEAVSRPRFSNSYFKICFVACSTSFRNIASSTAESSRISRE